MILRRLTIISQVLFKKKLKLEIIPRQRTLKIIIFFQSTPIIYLFQFPFGTRNLGISLLELGKAKNKFFSFAQALRLIPT